MPEISVEELDRLKRAAAGSVEPPPTPVNLHSPAPTADPAPYGAGWGKRAEEEFDIITPSGTRCRIKPLGLEDAMGLGLLDSIDMFTNKLMKPVLEATEKDAEPELDGNAMILKGLTDPEKRAKFFGMLNRIAAHVCIIPHVVLVDDGDLDEGIVFAGDIPFGDKMSIFRAVMGSKEATAVTAAFRDGSEEGLGTLADDEGVPPTAE
jgi:hypothetical protein